MREIRLLKIAAVLIWVAIAFKFSLNTGRQKCSLHAGEQVVAPQKAGS